MQNYNNNIKLSIIWFEICTTEITSASNVREVYYQLELDKMKEIDKWLEQFRKIWETSFSQLDDLLSTIKKQKG